MSFVKDGSSNTGVKRFLTTYCLMAIGLGIFIIIQKSTVEIDYD